MIYRELLVNPKGISIVRGYPGPGAPLTKPLSCKLHSYRNRQTCPICFSVQPNVLATCKMIRSEAQDELWTQEFRFQNPEVLHAFFLLLTPTSIARLRKIVILSELISHGGRHFFCFAPLRFAVNLRTLRYKSNITRTIDCWFESDEKAAERLATFFFKTMYPFVCAIAARKGVHRVLKIVKFHRDDMYLPGSQGDRPWSKARESTFLMFVKAHLIQLVGQEHGRVQAYQIRKKSRSIE